VRKIIPLLIVIFLILFVSSLKSSTACAYIKGSCSNQGEICYTDTQGPDRAPGYACGTNGGQHKDDNGKTNTYVYSGDNTTDIKGGYIVSCRAETGIGLGIPGDCCTPGTPLPQLPDHTKPDGSHYTLTAERGPGACLPNSTSLCYTGPQNFSPMPGLQCGDLTGWHYGTTGGSNGSVPSCAAYGFGNAACCDAGFSSMPIPSPFYLCPSQNGVCTNFDTALGKIDVSGPGGFIKTIFSLLLSLSGGVALILIIISGYRIMTAQGDPEKIKGAREMLTSAIIGLLFTIFSVTILQILGVNILALPGFGK